LGKKQGRKENQDGNKYFSAHVFSLE